MKAVETDRTRKPTPRPMTGLGERRRFEVMNPLLLLARSSLHMILIMFVTLNSNQAWSAGDETALEA